MSDYASFEQSHYLVDKFFLSYKRNDRKEKELHWQGKIVQVDSASSSKLMAACLLFSWMDGSPANLIMIDVDDFLAKDGEYNFTFFDNQNAWISASEKANMKEEARQGRDKDKIISRIYKERSISHRDLNRIFRVESTKLAEILNEAIADGVILMERVKNPNGGPATVIYSSAGI